MTCSYAKEFSASHFTDVENTFIYEYLPISSGETVKVYLYGLFLCQHPEHDQGLEGIAKTLKMEEKQVLDCFYYWEEFGLVSVVNKEPFTVQYLPVRTAYTTKPRKYKAEKYTDFTKGLQDVLSSRMISTGEYTEYFTIMETYGIKPEAMLMIVRYCADRKGTDIGYKYISKVAKDFGNRRILTVEAVEKELSSYVMRTALIEQILKVMSIRRQPEIEDATLLKKWMRELNFEPENIVFAASKLKKGSMEKLDQFLLELYSTKSFSKEEIGEYMSKKQAAYELAIKINKALSIYVDVVDTEVDTYINKWLSYGFIEDTLLFIASTCFKSGKSTLRDMDELVESLRGRGVIDLSSVGDYFESEKKTDEFISKLLITSGVNRRPTPWDRENVKVWKSWNFTEDMILEAAKLSAGKTSPTAYMNGILSSWKNKGVFTSDAIDGDKEKADDSVESYNREYERRRMLALSKAQKNVTAAQEIDGFNVVNARLNSIEKDLAFAEISGSKDTLLALEKEQAELNKKAESLLSTIGLTLRDLSPRFMCEKCSDTGYVGTHRCDCFNKKQ